MEKESFIHSTKLLIDYCNSKVIDSEKLISFYKFYLGEFFDLDLEDKDYNLLEKGINAFNLVSKNLINKNVDDNDIYEYVFFKCLYLEENKDRKDSFEVADIVYIFTDFIVRGFDSENIEKYVQLLMIMYYNCYNIEEYYHTRKDYNVKKYTS